MILILSPIAEKTTNDVVTWFLNSRSQFQRVTEHTPQRIEMGIDEYSINGIHQDQLSAFWVRKGYFTFEIPDPIMDESLHKLVSKYLNAEFKLLTDFLVKQLEQKHHLGNYFESNPNKLHHLQLAQEAGLEIPKTLITMSREKLLAFQEHTGLLISKSIKDSFTGTHQSAYYYNHTESITDEILADIPECFFPSLVQEELQKAYELRVVFVREKLYAMAIFSQNDETTRTDWRNYNHQYPNRRVPYQLPEQVTMAVRQFIQKSGLNMGAIDMVATKDGRYVFLECNPNGQVNMVSECCNYPIEKDIAIYLMYGDNTHIED